MKTKNRITKGADALSESCDKLGISACDNSLDYSGRGMYGNICASITVETIDEAYAIASEAKQATGKVFSVDNMGLDFVVYAEGFSVAKRK